MENSKLEFSYPYPNFPFLECFQGHIPRFRRRTGQRAHPHPHLREQRQFRRIGPAIQHAARGHDQGHHRRLFVGHGQADLPSYTPEVRLPQTEDVRNVDRERTDAQDAATVRTDEFGGRPGAEDVRRQREDHKARGRRGRHVLRRIGNGEHHGAGRQRQGGGDQQDREGRLFRGVGAGHA